jgi:phosphohistidine phosphatase
MRLYFLRHGLADRAAWEGGDFERPLTKEGEKRMAREAETMAELGLAPSAILTSPLVRARGTAEIVARRLGLMDRLVVEERLAPGFNISQLARILKSRSDAAALLLVGHEPDFSETIGRVMGGGSVVFKKGALARVDLYDVATPRGQLVWLIPPAALAL